MCVSQLSTPSIIAPTPGILPTPGQLSALDIPQAMPTPGGDSVFHHSDDLYDDVFYDEPTPTSAVVWSRGATANPVILRHRGGPKNEENQDSINTRPSQNTSLLHPLSAVFYEMPSPVSAELR